MGDILGTDAAKKMRELGYKGSIIFCTTSEEHALEGFRGRSYFVNMDSIETVKKNSIILKDGFEIFMPKRDLLKIKQDINDYIWKGMRK